MLKQIVYEHGKFLFVILCACMLLVLFVVGRHDISVSSHVYTQSTADSAKGRVEYYDSIYVESGDTLWSIARRYYSSEYCDLNKYMRRIQRMNHMTDTNLFAGTYLVVPYYAEAFHSAID